IALNGLTQYEEAIVAFDTALSVYPEYGYLAYYGKANALAGLGRYTDALQWYDKALGLESRYAEPWTNKGNAHAALGDYQSALTAYEKALSIEPNYLPAKNGLNAATANLSAGMPATQGGPQQTGTTAMVTTTPMATTVVQTTMQSTTPQTTQGLALPLWLTLPGMAFAVYLSQRRT
ncbi:MAG: tetratricopeptide repeat protein, partial [Burkholderiaceae bacterium]|nr:tetratricopeptide repeat protein [Burkholderiaceae bacterium]